MSDLGAKVVELTSTNEAYRKEKEEDSAILTKALANNANLQAKVEALKKETKKKKKTKKLEKEVADLQHEVEDLSVELDKVNQATKVGLQDGFCLARHQVLERYPDLDLSFLAALNNPEGPRWTWSKIELLNLPFAIPPAPKVAAKDAGDGASHDVGVP